MTSKKSGILALDKGGKTSKAAEIMKWWGQIPDGPKKTRVIADLVGCEPPYVRTVARQRRGKGVGPHDHAWLMRKWGGTSVAEAWRNRWRVDPKYRAARKRYLARKTDAANRAMVA